MRKLITIAAMIAIAFTAQAQTTKYDNSHKYGLLSNLEIGVGGIYSYNIADKSKNAGAQLLLTKRIGDFWRIRGVAEVNGFINNGFDRFGKGMVGISFDLLPFYLYADYGINFNPSGSSKIGLAAEAGAGLQFKLGSTSSIYIQCGIDRTNNGDKWNSNVEVTVGYVADLGITESDRVAIDIDNNMRSEYGDLKGENKLLKTELQKCQEATTSIQESAMQMAAIVESLQLQLAQCNTEKKEISDNCEERNDFYPVLFAWGSSEISEEMDGVIADIAEKIIEDGFHYNVYGYCSNNGTEWKNKILSEKRAEAVADRLCLYGVNKARLHTEGKGMTAIDKTTEQRVVVVRFK